MNIRCSAPGKLVLMGEYAVLFGHPAVVMAMDRRARVHISAPRAGRNTVTSPGLAPRPLELDIASDGTVHWSDPHHRLPLVEGLLSALLTRGIASPPPPFAAHLDTEAFFVDEENARLKLGLGSSAALTVALAAALLAWSGGEPPTPSLEWLGVLVRLHREARGGRGSGVDVAAALLGGVVEYRLGERGEVRRAERASLPASLRPVFVWTGRPADTGDYLLRLERRLGGKELDVERALDRLGVVSGAAVEALHRGSAGELLEAVDAFWDGLDELGRAAALDILSDEHRRAHDAVRSAGGSYKPSGAGGGDLGIALAGDPDAAAAVARAVGDAGFRTVDLAVEPTGLEVRCDQDPRPAS